MEYLGKVFPMAIMATLVVYCLKSIPESALQDNLILLEGVAVTAMVHLWKKRIIKREPLKEELHDNIG